MTAGDPKPEDIERKVNECLQRHDELRRLGARVIAGTAHREAWGWSVAVGTETDPAKMYQFIDSLGEVSDELHEKDHLDVVVAPSGVRPSDVVNH